jgi:hypothetical protein
MSGDHNNNFYENKLAARRRFLNNKDVCDFSDVPAHIARVKKKLKRL